MTKQFSGEVSGFEYLHSSSQKNVMPGFTFLTRIFHHSKSALIGGSCVGEHRDSKHNCLCLLSQRRCSCGWIY